MSTFSTVLLYCGTFILCMIFTYFSDKTGKKYGLILAGLFLTALAGFRAYSVGVDTQPYLESIFYRFETGASDWKMTSFSTGYAVFTKCILLIWDNATLLLLVEAAITNGLILMRCWDFRRSGNLTYMVFVYLMTIYLQTMCLTCQYIAIAIVFFATRFLEKRHPIVFCICTALASCIHTSAVIGFLAIGVYLILKKACGTIEYFLKILSFPVLLAALLLAYQMLSSRYSSYSSKSSSVGFMVFAQLAIFLAVLAYTHLWRLNTDKTNHDDQQTYRIVILLYACGILLSASSYVISNAGRIAYYFTIMAVPYYAICDSRIRRKNTPENMVIRYVLCSWFIVYFAYVFLARDPIGVLHYSTIFTS